MGPGGFLSALFSGKADTDWVLVWQLAKRKSFWSQSVAAAAKRATEIGSDVYVGCALSSEDRGEGKRGAAVTTAGIGALWADIDVLDPAHRKPNLPPTRADALALVDIMPLRPSILIDSGHGLQAWWLLDEFWTFENDNERARAAALVKGWETILQGHASARGWAVDSVSDLARILRIPGTVNAKREPHVPVTAMDEYTDLDRRYLIDDFEAFISSTVPPSRRASLNMKDAPQIVLNPAANPPAQPFFTIGENDERFGRTWNLKRRDFKNKETGDESPSVYDMALANFAAGAKWPDQWIADLLIGFRRKHGFPLKLDNLQYFQRTIMTARMGVKEDAAGELPFTDAPPPAAYATDATMPDATTGYAADSTSPAAPAPVVLSPADKRAAALAAMSGQFGFRVLRIVKLIAEQSEFRIETELGSVGLGPIKTIMSQALFRNQIADCTGRVMRPVKSWDRIAQMLLDAAEEESIGPEATDAGAGAAWLAGFLAQYEPSENIDEAIRAKMPFVRDGRTYFFLPTLRHWVKHSPHGEGAISAKDLGKKLRACGCAPEAMPYKNSTRSVWSVDRDVADKLKPETETADRAAAH